MVNMLYVRSSYVLCILCNLERVSGIQTFCFAAEYCLYISAIPRLYFMYVDQKLSCKMGSNIVFLNVWILKLFCASVKWPNLQLQLLAILKRTLISHRKWKTILQPGAVSILICCLTSKGIPIIKIWWSHDHVSCIMGTFVPWKTVLILRQCSDGDPEHHDLQGKVVIVLIPTYPENVRLYAILLKCKSTCKEMPTAIYTVDDLQTAPLDNVKIHVSHG